MTSDDLSMLPYDHPLRNAPLSEIGASYKIRTKGEMWHEVKPAFGIAHCTYNQLGPVWVDNHTWRATKK